MDKEEFADLVKEIGEEKATEFYWEALDRENEMADYYNGFLEE